MSILKKISVALAVPLLAAQAALAQNSNTVAPASFSPTLSETSHRFGAGLIVGEPTGVSLKYWLNDVMALDGAVGFRARDTDDVDLHADVLWHDYDLIPVSSGRMAAYVGAGPSVIFRHDEDNRFGIRVPVGLTYQFENAPVDVFAEVAPILDLSPALQGDFNVGIGVRYWF